MIQEKSIVVACDDKSSLTAMMNNMKDIYTFTYNIISVARESDLISIVKSVKPDLIILCFRNNQLTMNNFTIFLKKPDVPILCFNHRSETKALSFGKNMIVFSYPLELANSDGFLSSTLHSIFLLSAESPAKINVNNNEIATMQLSIDNSSRNLSRHVMELDQKVELLSKIKVRISELFECVDDSIRVELISIVNSIKLSMNDSKLWEDFRLYFEETNPEFLFLLVQKHPNLTPKDLKYCCYLKMNMTNDDIRNLLGINQESVRTHKHRLKKKMIICKEQDLRNYLLSLGK